MKTKAFFLLSIISLLWSCKDSTEDDILNISQSAFTVESSEQTLSVEISSNAEWKVVSNTPQWCSTSLTEGKNNATLKLSISANLNLTERSAIVSITSGKINREIKVTQKADLTINPDTYHYKLPVIFHVLYADKNNASQYPNASRFKELIEQCNKLYQSQINNNSVNMNLEFVLATESPTGYKLAEPGVEYIQWSSPVMDCYEFMTKSNSTNTALLWDLDKYINIMVYTFTENNTLGIAHLPFSLETSYLEGLSQVSYMVQTSNLKYPHSVSLNNKYINELTKPGYYNPYDTNVTLAHELGHYIGLHHAFSEDEDGNTDICMDTDYCKDTPTYNKVEYNKWVQEYFNNTPKPLLPDLAMRKECNGEDFVSYNLMDYAYSYSDLFTLEQMHRVRHVLAYSPLIPGPKKETRTRTLTLEGPQDLPIRVIK